MTFCHSDFSLELGVMSAFPLPNWSVCHKCFRRRSHVIWGQRRCLILKGDWGNGQLTFSGDWAATCLHWAQLPNATSS